MDPDTREDFDPVTARQCLQTVSSDEEQLEPAPYCSQCGSGACFRPSDTCRTEERLELAELIQTGWIGIASFETSVKTGAKPEEQSRLDGDLLVMRQKWENELEIRKLNVGSRSAAKVSY